MVNLMQIVRLTFARYLTGVDTLIVFHQSFFDRNRRKGAAAWCWPRARLPQSWAIARLGE